MTTNEPPQTASELLALPIIEITSDGAFPLAIVKTEGSCFAAKDDDGNWWVLEPNGDSWVRRSYPCRPW